MKDESLLYYCFLMPLLLYGNNQHIGLGRGFYSNVCMVSLILLRLQKIANSLHDSKLRGEFYFQTSTIIYNQGESSFF